MGGFYLIIPEERTADSLQIDPEILAKQLSSRWEDLEITNLNISSGTSAFRWTCNVQGEKIYGNLLAGQPTITIEDMDNERAIAEFLVWYRTLFPANIRLCLCHDSWGPDEIEITEHMSADEILQQLNEID